MNILRSKVGSDNLAYISWTFASVFWNLGFIFPSEHNISVQATNLSRGIGLITLNGLALYWRELFTNSQFSNHKVVDRRDLYYVSLRHILLTMYGYGFFQSQFYLPSPMVYTIYFSGPLFVILLQFIIYKITLTSRQIKGVIFTLLGVFLTINGQNIWVWVTNDKQFDTKFTNYRTDNLVVKTLVAIILVILSMGWATAVLLVRQVKGCSHWSLNFNLGYILIIVSANLFMVFPDRTIIENPWIFAQCILKQGLVTAIAQSFFMFALLITSKSGPLSLLTFVSVIFSYFLSIYRYNEALNIICVIGSISALAGIYFVIMK